MFAILHRALNDGARGLGRAQQRFCAAGVLSDEAMRWHPVTAGGDAAVPLASALSLRAGVLESGEKLVALNRPPAEDQPGTVASSTLDELFKGLDYERIDETLENTRSLTSEVWRTFLMLMALLLVGEALLCMPQKREGIVSVESKAAAVSAG